MKTALLNLENPPTPEPNPESPEPNPESPEPNPDSPEPNPESPEPKPEKPLNPALRLRNLLKRELSWRCKGERECV